MPKSKKAPSKSVNNSQPRMKAPRSRPRRPGKNVSSTGIRLVDTELLATVSVPKAATTVLFASVFSPRLVGTVMPSMAAVFETYKIHSVRYRYVAAASGFVAGQAYMGVSYDPTAENDDYDAAKICSLKEHWTGRISSSSSWVTVDPKIVRPDLVRHLDRSTLDLDSPLVLRFFGNLEAGKTASGAYPLGTIEVSYDITFAGFKPPASTAQPQNNLVSPQSKATIATFEATISCTVGDESAFSYKVETTRPTVFQKLEGKTAPVSSVPVRTMNAPVTSVVADFQSGVPASPVLTATRIGADISINLDDSYDGKSRYVVFRAQALAYDTTTSDQDTPIDPTKIEVTTPAGTIFGNSSYSIDASSSIGDGETGTITSVQYYSESGGPTILKYADQMQKDGALWVFSIQMVVVQLPSVELQFTAPDKLLLLQQQQPKQKEVDQPQAALSDILARLAILESRENNCPESLVSSTDYQFV